jgi:ribose 5-phosphate isomerase A
MADQSAQKKIVAARALDYVQAGMKLGLGSGSTAEIFVEQLGAKVRGGLKLICVPTSEKTAVLARKQGITLAGLDDLAPLDLTIDGADEADRNLNLIKGGGGQLLREKLVAAASRRMVVITDESKLVARLGRFALPVEVVSFGHKSTALRVADVLAGLGYARAHAPMTLREREGETFRTDSGNVIYDCALDSITDAPGLAAALDGVPGVVEHGLFIGLATTLLVAGSDDVQVIESADH